MIEKFQPDWRRTYRAEPTDRKPESALAPSRTHICDEARKYSTSNRMYMRSLVLAEPGIEAPMPMTSGCFSVSQMLIVAQSSGLLSTVGASAADAAGARAATTRGITAIARGRERTGAAYPGVMDRPVGRSVGVGSVMELSTSEPTTARFDALYRDTASDIFAFVMTLVRDRAAAEDVTAAAFERAYRRQAGFDPRRGTQRAWLFGIARNAALDELRRRRPGLCAPPANAAVEELRRRGRTAALLADPADPGGPHPDAPAEGDDPAEAAVRRAAVRAALAGLDARAREL